jgi:DNA-binding NarL/FixJ family response regulator
MPKPRVLLADDHQILIEGLRSLLEPEFELLPTVADGRALVQEARERHPDVIVADVSMPLLNGIEAARQILKEQPRARIVLLTMQSDVAYAAEAFRAGAAGYVLKKSAAAELVTAIREILNGGVYVTPPIAKAMMRDSMFGRPPSPETPGSALTSRQREVLQLVAEGHSIKEIGSILHVSPKTVEFHKYRVMEQLGLRTTAELTQYAVRHGIVAMN